MKVIAILLSVCLALAAASLGAYAPRGSYNRPARYNNYNNNYNRPYSRGYSNTRRGGYNKEVVTTATTEGPHTVATESHLTALCTKCSSKFTCLLYVMCCFYYLLLLNIENKLQNIIKFYVPHVYAVNL